MYVYVRIPPFYKIVSDNGLGIILFQSNFIKLTNYICKYHTSKYDHILKVVD